VREVMLREQKDWKKINQKWASMLSHMSLLNIFSTLVVRLSQCFITISCFVLRFSGDSFCSQCFPRVQASNTPHPLILCGVNTLAIFYK